MSDQAYEVYHAEKLVRKKRVYCVKWRGWPEEDSTWQSEYSLADAKDCLEEWKQSGRQIKRPKKTSMATPVEETKAEEADVTEAEEEKEVVVLTDTEAEETEAEEAEAEEAEKTEPVSQEGK